ncbi:TRANSCRIPTION FACTOR SCREAM2-RELATED [Salix purpurea]|uniref:TRANSCRIPTION FACTOR SCREAM2-RELATED n=1 Tax=Salix purpurea TaxID=77065 RepID=A0A9Q0UKU1_SALPP|nr:TRANSCRIPTION FACTOR SCREAM2-RELATED [Salix purpurea]
MDIIDNHLEYQNYWETTLFWNEHLDYSWETNQQFSVGCSDSSSPDENTDQTIASKNIVSERSRRKKLSDKLLALREAVPTISKLDKASVIKDAIKYIQDLQEQERILQADIRELESRRLETNHTREIEDELPVLLRSKRTKYNQVYDHWMARSACPIQVHELSVTSMGEKTLFVSLTCSKTTDAMIRICEVFESLKLKIITANITTLSGMVKKTVLIEVDEEEKEHLKTKIERGVSALRSAYNPMMGI